MLRDIDLKNSYTSGFDEPKFFFTEALLESSKFDLGLGFFSSSGIKALAPGFAVFIANGGVMRVIINQYLSDEDKAAIELGQSKLAEAIEDRIISDIDALSDALSGTATIFFKCFSYLISIERIEFVATISTKGGLAHDKYGIFTDTNGDKVAFIGSANWSKTAMELNGETITAFSSWNDHERVLEYQSLFEKTWSSDTPHLIHIPMNKVKSHIKNNFKIDDLSELITDGLELVENELNNNEDNQHFPEYLANKINEKSREPRFPFSTEREIQKNAYKSWVDNNYNGIFAMATGSGKTVTALNCILKEYKKSGFYKAIIVVPTQALARQWEEEANAFNFENIISTHTCRSWKTDINRYATNSRGNPNKSLIIITTYATFCKDGFQDYLRKLNDYKSLDNFIYVADEAHNLGSKTALAFLPYSICKRIGLSATPERVYDEMGSQQLFDFFNSYPPLYTYRYTMKQAIDDKILCPYRYYPIFVRLTEEEMVEYRKITKQLCKFIDPKTGVYSEMADALLLKRKRIIHKASNKKSAILGLLNNLKDKHQLKYTFVFVPEGYEPDYSVTDLPNEDTEDIHIIDEYAQIFKNAKYKYHQYISGLGNPKGVLSSFADGDIDILLSMKCLDEGIDIPRAEHAIFCASTGNPRQFVQRRGRVLRVHKDKKIALIWDLIVIPPDIQGENYNVERNLFLGEVKRIVNFAVLAEESNRIETLYGELNDLCDDLGIDLFDLVEKEVEMYN